MSEAKTYLQKLFSGYNINIASNRQNMFDAFAAEEQNIEAVTKIIEFQKTMMDKWILKNRITDVVQQSVKIPNATVGKQYEAKMDFVQLGWNDIVYSEFEGLEQYGLQYDNEHETIAGIPVQSGDFKVNLKFRIEGEAEDSVLNVKPISLIINADPKSLWKTLPSNKDDKYWKPDDVEAFEPLGDKHIVVSSKRGRSHANVGSFRDDDYAFKYLEKSGWGVVAVADGAGSAKSARKGSELVCRFIVQYFDTLFVDGSAEIDALALAYSEESKLPKQPEPAKAPEVISPQAPDAQVVIVDKQESAGNKISRYIYNTLGGAAKKAHNHLEEFATKNEIALKDLHSTLIFALYKKYDFGYVVLSFGVGDCPIGLLNKDMTELKLMNWLDVGEFGGGTRFITMPEIFTSDKFSTRFGFKQIEDFSYLVLMTDGIYDPKFEVEANLEKLDKWKAFFSDLQGNNEDKIKVDFDKGNKEIAGQLSSWMDFWSPGNHDDRTLAIVF